MYDAFYGFREKPFSLLPDPEYLRAGDYILLVAFSGLRFQPGQAHLELDPGRRITVEHKLTHKAGYLLEVR